MARESRRAATTAGSVRVPRARSHERADWAAFMCQPGGPECEPSRPPQTDSQGQPISLPRLLFLEKGGQQA